MPDPNTDPNVADPNAPDPAIEAAKAVADAIRKELEANRPAPTPVVVSVPASTDDTQRQALIDEGVKVTERVDALMAEGKFAEALNVRDAFNQKASQFLAGKPEDSPVLKSAVSHAKRLAKSENPDLFAKWGDEITKRVESMPVTERISPEAWDKAIADTRAAHFDELLEVERTKIKADYEKNFTPPSLRPGTPGPSRELNLSAEEMAAAVMLGVDPKDYAANKKLETLATAEGVPVMPLAAVAPGRF